jgi:flagellar biosynthetic protein FlhB
LKGVKRLFALRSIVELGKSILKLLLIGTVIYLTVLASSPLISSLTTIPVETLGRTIGELLTNVFFIAALSLLIIGVLDYAYQKFEFEKSLKMTKEEVKEESKQSEGDPHVKGKVREIMIRSAIKRMMKKIPEADVVITNPIHLAVAIKYDRSRNSAPIVVAKGARKVAERIKALAAEHDIPIIENNPLARALFKLVDIGQEIPADLYKAVAEVLAYVYRLKRKFFSVT